MCEINVHWLAQCKVELAWNWCQKCGRDSSRQLHTGIVCMHVKGPTVKSTHIWSTCLWTLSTIFIFCPQDMTRFSVTIMTSSLPSGQFLMPKTSWQGNTNKKWIDITEKPTEDELVILALTRIQQDPNQYDLFIDMLRNIPGMDLTVDGITSRLWQYLFCVLITFVHVEILISCKKAFSFLTSMNIIIRYGKMHRQWQPVDIRNSEPDWYTSHVMVMYIQHQQLYVVLLHQDGYS